MSKVVEILPGSFLVVAETDPAIISKTQADFQELKSEFSKVSTAVKEYGWDAPESVRARETYKIWQEKKARELMDDQAHGPRHTIQQ